VESTRKVFFKEVEEEEEEKVMESCHLELCLNRDYYYANNVGSFADAAPACLDPPILPKLSNI
jgi:hypothetical protein